MKLNENDLPEFMRELRHLLGNLKGVSGRITETFSLSYVLVVNNEEERSAVLQVANMLTEKAAQDHGIDLEIVPATVEEVEHAAELLKQHQAATKGSFVL